MACNKCPCDKLAEVVSHQETPGFPGAEVCVHPELTLLFVGFSSCFLFLIYSTLADFTSHLSRWPLILMSWPAAMLFDRSFGLCRLKLFMPFLLLTVVFYSMPILSMAFRGSLNDLFQPPSCTQVGSYGGLASAV